MWTNMFLIDLLLEIRHMIDDNFFYFRVYQRNHFSIITKSTIFKRNNSANLQDNIFRNRSNFLREKYFRNLNIEWFQSVDIMNFISSENHVWFFSSKNSRRDYRFFWRSIRKFIQLVIDARIDFFFYILARYWSSKRKKIQKNSIKSEFRYVFLLQNHVLENNTSTYVNFDSFDRELKSCQMLSQIMKDSNRFWFRFSQFRDFKYNGNVKYIEMFQISIFQFKKNDIFE